ncbi:MAG TPA: hypothetical protein VIG38_05310 [Hyphomicrobium sp.]|jgi:hypothetical protein
MFASHDIQPTALAAPRPRHGLSRLAGVLIVGGITLFLGACAHNGGEAPGVQWQFNAADAGSAGPMMYSVDSAPAGDTTVERSAIDAPAAEGSEHNAASACGQGDTSGWSDNCYVYRGGRDPVTGRAYTQL